MTITPIERLELTLKIPSSFELGGATWSVVQIKDLTELGLCLRDVRTIQLKQNSPAELKEQTFYHELVHAIKFTMGEDNHDEKEVDVFATFLHQFMKTKR